MTSPVTAVTPVSGSTAPAPLLRLRDVRTHFPVRTGVFGSLFGAASAWVKAVDGVDLDVYPGEIFGLVGESGSGKTTLGRTVLRLVEPVSGTVEFDGDDIAHWNEARLRPLRRQIQLIFQDPNAALNPAMTIGEGVAHPLRIHGLATSREDARRQAAEMLERVGIEPAAAFLDRYPDDLSGGQKQRVVIARALITRPRLVVADEPVAMLDMSVRAMILKLMLDLQREFGLTYVFITHDLATAKFVCDRIAIMYLGRIAEMGPAEAIYARPAHPYTASLLAAVPRPDPSRRGTAKVLPEGEVPDALSPPRGCRFHPRCPQAFAPCGWEGRDLVELLEARWAADPTLHQRESPVVGSLDRISVTPDAAVFARGGDGLVQLLEAIRAEAGDRGIWAAVASISSEAGSVVVRFGPRREPALQDVDGRVVACHLHGVTDDHAAG